MKFQEISLDPKALRADELVSSMFFSADLNGDGMISLDEWSVLHGNSFDLLQLNEEENPEAESAPEDQVEEKKEEKEEEVEDPYEETWELDIVFFAFFCLMMGQLFKIIAAKTGIPYTTMITVFGIFLGTYEYEWGRFGNAIHLWS